MTTAMKIEDNAPQSLFSELVANPLLAARRMTFAPGRVLYEPTSAASNLYFIHRGQIRTYVVGNDHQGRLVDILGPDAWFGEAALARQAVYGEQAVAVVASVVSEVSADRFLQVLATQPRSAGEVYRHLASKLTAAREDAAALIFDDCHARLIKALLRFSTSAAASPHGDGVLLRITHDQLAQAIGVARETVSLALTELRQYNLLRTGRNQLLFNPEALKAFMAAGRKPTQSL